MQFAKAHPVVAATLTGARDAQEIKENVAMYEFPIPDALWTALRDEHFIAESAPVPGARS